MGGVMKADNVDALLAKMGTRYGLVNRPFGIGCVPRGVQYNVLQRPDVGSPHHDYARHGVLEAGRSLTHAEVRAYELAPLVDASGTDAVAELVAVAMSQYAAEYLQVKSEDAAEYRRGVLDLAQRAVDGVRLSISDADAMVDAVTKKLTAHVSPAG